MERIKALRLLAESEGGCTAPTMVRYGCTMPTLRRLVREGLASVERGQARQKRSWRAVFLLRITGAGRKALTE
jgi:DNA-binding PadR family transcriptional regulator